MSARTTERETTMTEAASTMKAVVRDRFGSPDVLALREVAKPELVDDGVLVRVRAASVNAADWYDLKGMPLVARTAMGLRTPKQAGTGTDFAGTVEAVGKDVAGIQPGDEVFGARSGSCAEYVCVRGAVGRKPANLSFEKAAAVPVAAITALQGLRDKGGLQPGQKVLVNGASGGVGTFAVQIAKLLGADLTAVCSTRNVETARSLGADRVVDYTREDFTRIGERFDLVLDVSGTRSWSDYKRILAPGATHVIVGAPRPGARLLGPLRHVIKLRLASLGSSRKVVFFIAKLNKPDLAYLAELLESGAIRPVIEKTYSLGETAEALRYLGEGHARGKLVITV
jgi:NADPH:quinone reductase-like Zn-dependent oxidoreductase